MYWRFLSNIVQIGNIIKAHGIVGEMLIRYHAESIDLLKRRILLGKHKDAIKPVVVDDIRYNREKILIKLQGITSRTEAEKLRGYFLFIESSSLPVLDPMEVYRIELFGFSIYANNECIGVLEDIQDIAGQELWYIRATCGKEILFPAVDQFIEKMDFEQRCIRISPPLGLLSLYLE